MSINDQYRDLIVEYFNRNTKVISTSIFNSGRDALFAIFKALDLSKNDEVIIQSYTCKSVVDAIKIFEATPIFIDIDKSFTMSIRELKEKVTSKTKIIISQNTYGIEPDLKAIEEIALDNKIYHIQDLCQGYNDISKTINTIAFSSSQWNKVFNTFNGGFTIIEDRDIATKVAKTEQRLNKESNFITLISYFANYTILKIRGSKLETYISKILHFFENRFCNNDPSFCIKRLSSYKIKKGLNEFNKIDNNLKHRQDFSNTITAFLKLNNKQVPLKQNIPYTYFPIKLNDKKYFLKCATKENILFYNWPLSPISPIVGDLTKWNINIEDYPQSKKAINETVLIYTSPDFPFSYKKKVLSFLQKHIDLIL